ncbi:MAG: M20/M25/M40 family metallo-hydrolase [Marinicaulis sp.]|nr:M20/M25/M40 family metallo-hydrolase [Marinicaulis sp.]
MIRQIFLAAMAAISISTAAAAEVERTADEQMAFEIYRTIIGMRTAKGHGMVPEMAAYLAGELKSAGFSDDDINILPFGETAGMTVHYRGDGSTDLKPNLFLAHMDVVDANRDDWEYDPFVLREENGYFLGRGTADNKYGVANLTQTFMRLKRDGFTPVRDLVLVFSGDEETEMNTTRMLAYDRKDLTDAEFALNSDASGGGIDPDGNPLPYLMQSAEKTYATFLVTANNQGGHSSRPRPDNAIYELADALKKIQGFEFPVEANSITRASMMADGKKLGGDLGKHLVAFSEDPTNKKAVKYFRKNNRYDNMIGTTCVATMLNAGHAENALPQSATATVNCRIFPGNEIEDVRKTLVKVVDNDALTIEPADDRYVASPISEPREDVTAALAKALHSRFPGLEIVPSMSAGGTDGMHFRRAGVPTYGAGGGFAKPGDTFAHGLNERVQASSFYGGLDHWMILIKEIAGPKSDKASASD